MPTTTKSPFFGSFLSAFRAHTAVHKAAVTSPTGAAAAAGPTVQASFGQNTTANTASTSNNSPSQARSVSTKAGPAAAGGATTVALQSPSHFQPTRQHPASPYARSPGPPGATLSPLQPRGRRGSDSSSEGFRESASSMGGEKWYIGGRTAGGEERVYKLSMVKRPRSVDRLSLDRMSL